MKVNNRENLDKIWETIKNNENFVIVSHTNPDGDTVGAGTGLAHLLNALGKQVKALVCDREIPKYLSFLCEKVQYVTDFDPDADDTVISVDVASPQMLGTLSEKLTDRVDLRIDHHEVCTPFAKENVCIPTASSCCEIIAELSEYIGVATAESSTALLCGIMTDTGSFRYSCTTSRTHGVAAFLIDSGADLDYLNSCLYESRELSSLLATSYGVTRMKLLDQGRIATCIITDEDKRITGCSDGDFSETASLMRQIRGVEAALFLRQADEAQYKLSVRSGKNVDAAALCALFGGGGHVRAAGATLSGSDPKELMEKAVSEVQKQLGTNN